MSPIDLLVKQIELVWRGTLIGGGVGLITRRFEFMQSAPAIDDLVLIDHVGRNVPAGDRIGWLVAIEDVPLGPEFEDDHHIPTERYWRIDRLDGSGEIRWTNVAVLRVFNEDGFPNSKQRPVRRYVPMQYGHTETISPAP